MVLLSFLSKIGISTLAALHCKARSFNRLDNCRHTSSETLVLSCIATHLMQ